MGFGIKGSLDEKDISTLNDSLSKKQDSMALSILSNNIDIDTLISTAGRYWVLNDNTSPNSPFGSNFYMLDVEIAVSNGAVVQIAYPYGSNLKPKYRMLANKSWSDWSSFA